MANKERYIEPTGDQRAGWHKGDDMGSFTRRLPTAWEMFLKEEGLPIFKGVGIRDSRELPRTDREHQHHSVYGNARFRAHISFWPDSRVIDRIVSWTTLVVLPEVRKRHLLI